MLVSIAGFVTGLLIVTSCTKEEGTIEDRNAPMIELVKTMSPNPMPPDSLELDSLRRIEFR